MSASTPKKKSEKSSLLFLNWIQSVRPDYPGRIIGNNPAPRKTAKELFCPESAALWKGADIFPDYWAGLLVEAGDFSPAAGDFSQAGLSSPRQGRIIRPRLTPTSRFWEGYKYPFPFSTSRFSSCCWRTPYAEPPKLLDLLLQPPKSVDLWRIEGEDLDLHSHRSDLIFPLIHLRDLCLVFLWKP